MRRILDGLWDESGKRMSTYDACSKLFVEHLLKSSVPKVIGDGSMDLLRKRITHLGDPRTKSDATNVCR